MITENAFILAARTGHNEFWRYLLTIFLVISLLSFGSLLLVLVIFILTGSMDLLALPPVPFLALNLVPFVFALGGLWLGLVWIHRRPLISILNPLQGRFNARRFFLSAGLWLLLSALADLVLSLLQPGNYQFNFDPARFFPYFLVALLLLPIQSITEELFFRGYLTQALGLKGGFWLAWLAPSILFALLHGANPEVGAYGVLFTLPTYLIVGLLLGWVTLRSESLELAMGLHVANNLYAATFVTFPSSVLQSPAIFRIQAYDALASLITVAVLSLLYLFLLNWTGRGILRRGLTGGLALVLLLSACSPAGTPAAPAAADAGQPGLLLADCWLQSPQGQFKAQCGTLMVPEDPSNPAGKQIELNVAVHKAVSRTPSADPLFLLAGGPGQAATEAFLPTLPYLQQVRFKRDLVMVDQRGTGKSNPLDCPESSPAVEGMVAGKTFSLEEQLAWVDLCKASLDFDPRLYTTEIAAHDLDQVRQALGYEQINLLGVSYGTRAAMTYLRLYPQQVRSLILDGVVPPGWALASSTGPDTQRAIDLIFDRCAGDEACRTAFPELEQSFIDLMDSLRSDPRQVSVPHPTSGRLTPVQLNTQSAAAVVRLMSYSDLLTALMPLAIHSAAQGDEQLLAGQYMALTDDLSSGLSMGMYYSVFCAEDEPLLPDLLEGGSYFDPEIDEVHALCERWRGGPAPAPLPLLESSDVPTLLISGDADPVTPPENGRQAAERLPNNLHLVLSGLGHNNFYAGCVPRILQDFLESGSPRNLETACIHDIQPQPFFVSPAGPVP